ncbi:hypothetical protein GCM10009623_32550 [Nocardioides aestuarii]|uniref:Uncharacterized protein n=1 Tax=Nocardioides aestuarii TaxID=252231 RepID=A0ABW4TTM5_9ACTN
MTPSESSHLTIVPPISDLVTELPDPREQVRGDSQLRRLSRQTMGMAGLLERRPELRGVSTWSEGVVESVLWSA